MKVNPSKHLNVKFALAAMTLGLAAFPSQAQITEVNAAGGGTDWNTASLWSNNAAPSSGNTYITVTGLGGGGGPDGDGLGTTYSTTIRSYGQTFGGASLEIAGNTRLLLKEAGGGSLSASLILDANSDTTLADSGGAGNVTVGGTILVAGGASGSSPAYLNDNNTTAEDIDVTATISGSGSLALGIDTHGPDSASQAINLNTFSSYSGTLQVYTEGTFSIGEDAGSGSSVSLPLSTLDFDATAPNGQTLDGATSATTFNLYGRLTLKGLDVGSTVISPGTYTAAQLDTADGGTVDFADPLASGATLTVVPEPDGYAFFSTIAGGLFLILRRRCLMKA